MVVLLTLHKRPRFFLLTLQKLARLEDGEDAEQELGVTGKYRNSFLFNRGSSGTAVWNGVGTTKTKRSQTLFIANIPYGRFKEVWHCTTPSCFVLCCDGSLLLSCPSLNPHYTRTQVYTTNACRERERGDTFVLHDW